MSLHRTVGTSLLPTSGPIFSLFDEVSTVISASFLWSRGIAQVSTTQRGKEVRQSVCSTILKMKVNVSECRKTEAASRIKISQNQRQIRMHASGGVLPSILIIDSDSTSFTFMMSHWRQQVQVCLLLPDFQMIRLVSQCASYERQKKSDLIHCATSTCQPCRIGRIFHSNFLVSQNFETFIQSVLTPKRLLP